MRAPRSGGRSGLVSRRRFLTLAGTAGAAASTGLWSGLLREHVETAVSAATTPKRTLVVVQLAGGNDGLNTLVPDDGRYRDARPTLAILESDVLRPDGLSGYGLHPALAPIVPLVEAGQVCAVQSVGLHHQSRSHFECSQHWWDGSDGHMLSETGWIGRWLDATKPSGPSNPLRALSLGNGAGAPALRAEESVATVVIEPSAFRIKDAGLEAAFRKTAAPLSPDALLALSQQAVTSALSAADSLAGPLAGATTGQGTLTETMALAAELVTANLGIEVLLVGSGGFDTHSGQAATHDRLLGELAEGIASFQSAIDAAGMADNVLLLTTSEFGRRVAENGSGTDHGLGNVLFAVGSSINGGVVGELDLANLTDGDIMPMIDPRSYMAIGLDFLGGPTDEVFESYEDLGILI